MFSVSFHGEASPTALPLLILTEVVPSNSSLGTLNTLLYNPTHNKIDTDYADYALLKGCTLKHIHY